MMLSVSRKVQARKGLQGVTKGAGGQGPIQLRAGCLCGSDRVACPLHPAGSSP